VAFSPDGARLATASYDGTARVWEAASGKELAVLRGPGGDPHVVAFSPDGTRLTTASDEGAGVWIARESDAERENRLRFRRSLWREQKAAAAETNCRWFAAAFHLGQMIRERPDEPVLYARRGWAYAAQGKWSLAADDFLRGAALCKPAD
jgi:hypothetical protein